MKKNKTVNAVIVKTVFFVGKCIVLLNSFTDCYSMVIHKK